jgi:formylglycine-generating enzyme required for sulfatase activity
VQRAARPTVRITVPTCDATLADTIAIPAGPFIFGGAGEPPSPVVKQYPHLAIERELTLPAFRIDRTEVTNAAYGVFGALVRITGIATPVYPPSVGFEHAAEPDHPVAMVTWAEARAYCRFLGKDLPSSEQWERVLRGGLTLADGSPNPHPRRSYPWGADPPDGRARFTEVGLEGIDTGGTAAVGSHPDDRSPDGVLDLAGNVNEWTSSLLPDQPASPWRVVRGGEWLDTTATNALEYVGVINQRLPSGRYSSLGVRCAGPP